MRTTAEALSALVLERSGCAASSLVPAVPRRTRDMGSAPQGWQGQGTQALGDVPASPHTAGMKLLSAQARARRNCTEVSSCITLQGQ